MLSPNIPPELTQRIYKFKDLLYNEQVSELMIKRKFDLQGREKITGIYAFWLIKGFDESVKLNKVVSMIGRDGNQTYTLWQDNLTEETENICLYTGWTDDLIGQIDNHLMLNVQNWYKPHKNPNLEERLNEVYKKHDNLDFIFMRNPDCRFRAGFEHLFQRVLKDEERMQILEEHIGLSFYEIIPDKGVYDLSINEAFYLEHLCIGYLKPWFNLNVE